MGFSVSPLWSTCTVYGVNEEESSQMLPRNCTVPDDTQGKIKIQKQAFTEYINAIDTNVNFIREYTKSNKLAFLDYAVLLGTNGNRNRSLQESHGLTSTIHFKSKLGVIRMITHRAENIPTSTKAKNKEHKHLKIKGLLCIWRPAHILWAFHKIESIFSQRTADKAKSQGQKKKSWWCV